MLSNRIEDNIPREKYPIVIFAYLIGKILVAFIWVSIATMIFSARSARYDYYQYMNHLDDFMQRRGLNKKLQEKLKSFFKYKLHGRIFDTKPLDTVPNTLKKDITHHIYERLTKTIDIFSFLDEEELKSLRLHLTSEIYIPMSTIFKSGDPVDCLYFISSGTVALYTYSGKELCHLGDGAYFGEVSLMMKHPKRLLTIIAIEFCEIVVLKQKFFEKYLMNNKKAHRYLKLHAERRFGLIQDIETKYRYFYSQAELSTFHPFKGANY